MTSTPNSVDVVSLNDSWVDINDNNKSPSDTPFHGFNKNTAPTLQSLEKLLLDAQKESGQSSLKGSYLDSSPITPDGLQTPPNSLFYNDPRDRNQMNTDWLWDWSNRDLSSKDWSNSIHNRKTRLTFRQWIIRRHILSKEVLFALLCTNIFSLILGAGIGYSIIIRKAF